MYTKYKFNEEWDPKQRKYKESVIGFNKTIIKFQLDYFIRFQFAKNVTEITNATTPEGLSGIDKMAMNLTKLNEGEMFRVDVNIRRTIDFLKKRFNIPVTEEEIAYYKKHFLPSSLQITIVHAYFARYFGSCRDLKLLTKRDYLELSLLLKKKLLLELGYDNEDGKVYRAFLPYILTGNLEDKVNTRVIRNAKFIQKLEEDDSYQELMRNIYKGLDELHPDYIKSLLSQLINSRFTYVTYEKPELTGTEIEYFEDKISSESVYYLKTIQSRVA